MSVRATTAPLATSVYGTLALAVSVIHLSEPGILSVTTAPFVSARMGLRQLMEDIVKTALVVLDMLNDFIDGTLANKAAEEVIDPIASLVEGARARDDWVVVYANDAHQPNDLEFAVFGEHALAGTKGAAVVSDLKAAEGDIVVPKRFYSAFTDTDLDATCRVHDIERMVIVGQHTNCCCRHTSYDAFLRGIELAVVSDGTCVYEPLTDGEYDRVQRESLNYLNTFYNADVVEASAVF